MDDAVAMRLVERVGDLGRDRQRLVERERPFLEPRGQRLALEMRHDKEERAIDAADIVDAADVRMVQRGDGARLALEAGRRSESPADSLGRTLMATVRSSRVSRALYTSPMPPAPSGPETSYGPRRVPGGRAIGIGQADYSRALPGHTDPIRAPAVAAISGTHRGHCLDLPGTVAEDDETSWLRSSTSPFPTGRGGYGSQRYSRRRCWPCTGSTWSSRVSNQVRRRPGSGPARYSSIRCRHLDRSVADAHERKDVRGMERGGPEQRQLEPTPPVVA